VSPQPYRRPSHRASAASAQPPAHGRLGPRRPPRTTPGSSVESRGDPADLREPLPWSLLCPADRFAPRPPSPRDPTLPPGRPEQSSPGPGDPQPEIQRSAWPRDRELLWPAAPTSRLAEDPAHSEPRTPVWPPRSGPAGPVPLGPAHPRPCPPVQPWAPTLRHPVPQGPLCPCLQAPRRPSPPALPQVASPCQPRRPLLMPDREAGPLHPRSWRGGRAEPGAPSGGGAPAWTYRQPARQPDDPGRAVDGLVPDQEGPRSSGGPTPRPGTRQDAGARAAPLSERSEEATEERPRWRRGPRAGPTRGGRAVLGDLVAGVPGGGLDRSFGPRMLPRVAPRGGRRAQPIGAEALPRRLSTTWAAPIPPAAAEG
jgi:hypothetical protein